MLSVFHARVWRLAAPAGCALCCLFLTACPCVGSLHPLYGEGDVVMDPALLGEWDLYQVDEEGHVDESESPERIVFEERKKPGRGLFELGPSFPEALYKPTWVPSYRVTVPDALETEDKDDGDNPEDYFLRLVEVKGERFLDVMHIGEDGPWCMHWFLHLRKTEDAVDVAFLSQLWLPEYLAEHRRAIAHEVLPFATGKDAALLLTAKPKKLQRVLVKHLDTPEAWMPCLRLVRPEGSEPGAKAEGE